MSDAPRYPHVHVPLSAYDGNAFSILALVQRALLTAGVGRDEVSAYVAEATSSDYNHLLVTTMAWVTVV